MVWRVSPAWRGIAGIAGIAGMVKLNALPGPPMAKAFLRSASWALRVRDWPSRLIPRFTNTSRRNFADHAAQLLHTFHLVAVDAENYVVLFDSGLAGGSILIDQSDLYSMFFFQLQIGQAVRSDVASVDTEIGSAAEVLAGISEGFAERLLRAKLSAAW